MKCNVMLHLEISYLTSFEILKKKNVLYSSKAPSTRIWIFFNRKLFVAVLPSVHVYPVNTDDISYLKTLPRVDFFPKSALNTASRKRPNPYIFGNADVAILDPIRFRTDNLYQ